MNQTLIDIIIGTLLIASIFVVVPAFAKTIEAMYKPDENTSIQLGSRYFLITCLSVYPAGALICGLYLLIR